MYYSDFYSNKKYLSKSNLHEESNFSAYDFEKFSSQYKASSSFTQSLMWTKVKKDWDYDTIVLKDKNKNTVCQCLVLIKKLPFIPYTFLYSPRGPLCDFNNQETLELFTEEVKRLCRKHRAFLFKADPYIDENDNTAIENLTKQGFIFNRDKSEDETVQCKSYYLLNIENKTQDEVFADFHSKYRYNIRLAIKKGVDCRYYGKEKLKDFCKLMEETGKRDGFCTRSIDYFEKIMDAFGKHCRLYMCYKDGVPLSGAIAINYGGKTAYVYGASSSQHRELMPNYLMQWTMIKWAIETGCIIYDFQGIPHFDDESHPNYGVYRFKKGFNGYVQKYAGEFDYVAKPLIYRITKLFRKNI